MAKSFIDHNVDPTILEDFKKINEEDNKICITISKLYLDTNDFIDICELCLDYKNNKKIEEVDLQFKFLKIELIDSFVEIIKNYFYINFNTIHFKMEGVDPYYWDGVEISNTELSKLFISKFDNLLKLIDIDGIDFSYQVNVRLDFVKYTNILNDFKSTVFLKNKQLKINNKKYNYYHNLYNKSTNITNINFKILNKLNKYNNDIENYYNKIKKIIKKREKLYKTLKILIQE